MEYLEATMGDDPANPQEAYRLRAEVTRTIPAAQAAMNAAGVNPVVYPPPAFGGMIYRGLANTAFLHESPGYRLGTPSIPQQILDATQLAHAQLEQRREASSGIPIPKVRLGRIARRAFGAPFRSLADDAVRLITIVGGGLAIYFGGAAAGWW